MDFHHGLRHHAAALVAGYLSRIVYLPFQMMSCTWMSLSLSYVSKWLLLLDSNQHYFCFRGRRHNHLGEGAIIQIYFPVYKISILVLSD